MFSYKFDAFVGLSCGCGCFGWVDILFVMLRLARRATSWNLAGHVAAADDVFDGDLFCVVFSQMEWVGT